MKHNGMKMSGKLVAMFALALLMALGGVLLPEAWTAARADTLASDGSGGWKYEIPSGEDKTLDLTSDANVTSGFQFHLIAAGASGSVHIQANPGYILRAQGNVDMNQGDGVIRFFNGADPIDGNKIEGYRNMYSSALYCDHSSSGSDLYIDYASLGGSYFDFTVTVIDPAIDLSYAAITGVDSLYLYTGEVLPVTFAVRDGSGRALSEGTDYTTTVTRDGAASEIKEPGDYTLTITAKEGSGLSGSKSVGFRVNKGLPSGAEANTYLITGQEDWKSFSELVAYGFDFRGKTVKLSADIDHSDYNGRIGTKDHPFTGTFDGGGKKITINTDGIFYYINGVTIQNLWADQGNSGNSVIIKYKDGSGRNAMKNVLFTTKGDAGDFYYGKLDSCADVYGTFTDDYGNGVKVTATTPTEGLYRPVTAVNAQTYYIPATVSGMQEQYPYTGYNYWPDYIVTDTSGKVLKEQTDYTVAIFAANGDPVDGIEDEGSYTVKCYGMGDYLGEQSFACACVSPSGGEINSWSALQAAMSGSGAKVVRLTGDIEASDSDSALTVPSGLTVNLDLAGYTIDRKRTAETEKGNVITVEGTLIISDSGTNGTITGGWSAWPYGGGIHVAEGGSLTLRGGAISNNKASDSGGGVRVASGGSFTMSGGVVSGNRAQNGGGGVYLDNYSGGSAFIMTGGTISGNTAASEAGGVSGSMIMSGNASITGNTAGVRSAVYGNALTMVGNASIADNHSSGRSNISMACSVNSFSVSDSARVTGNTNGDDLPANLPVSSNLKIRISGTLTDSARIGVTSWESISTDAPLIFTNGLSGRGNAGNFTSDQGYAVSLTGDGEAMLTGDTITFFEWGENHVYPYDPTYDMYITHQRVFVERGDRVTRPTDPVYPSGYTGMTFSGWFLDADCTEPYDFDTPVSGSFALYPCWQKTLTAEDVSLAAGTYTYSGEEIRPEVTVEGILSSVIWHSGHPTGTLTPNRDYTVEYTDNIQAGTATVTVTGKRIHRGTVTKTFEIGKVDATLAIAPTPKAIPCTGKAQELVTAGTAEGGTVQYALGTATEATQPYTASIATATDEGTYYVWYKVVGDANHTDTDPAVVTANIYPAFGESDFTLPSSIQTVEASAFEADALITAVDASHCASIGAKAFKDCAGLNKIRLPKNCAIAEDAFTGCGTVYVYAPAGGTTETACAGIPNLVFVAEDPNA